MIITNNPNAIKLLESLQIHAEEKYPQHKVKKYDFKKYKKSFYNTASRRSFELSQDSIESHLAQVQALYESLPTQNEDIVAYGIIAGTIPELSKAADYLGYELPEHLTIGTVCSGTVNAHLITVDLNTQEYLLVMNRQIFYFTALFSDFLATCIVRHYATTNSGQQHEQQGFSEEEFKYLKKLLYYFSTRLNFLRDEDGSISTVVMIDSFMDKPSVKLDTSASKKIAEILKVSMNNFIISHELVHLSLNNIQKNENGYEKGKHDSFAEELKCDAYGSRIGIQAAANVCQKRYPSFPWNVYSLPGSLFFLLCFDIFEKYCYLGVKGTELPNILEEVDTSDFMNNCYNSHPTTLFRRSLIKTLLFDELDRAKRKDDISLLFGVYDWIESCFHNTWPEIAKESIERGKSYVDMLGKLDASTHKGQA